MLAGQHLVRFAAALERCGIRHTDRIAVALSGGPDSLALAAMTVAWQRHAASGYLDPPLALTVDHKLRPESGAEAAAVAAQAEQLGLESRVLTVSWPGGQPPRPADKMVAARQARYEVLLAACTAARARHLLLAHHADDQAETFLLRLLHASGVAGLACMPEAVDRHMSGGQVTLVRPLLGFRKADLETYCRLSGLPYVVDPTNADLAFLRNRIRHVLHSVPAPAPRGTPPAGGMGSAEAGTWGNGAGSSASPACPPIIDDVLLLQRRCQVVACRQEAAAERLLRQAVLHCSCPGPPAAAQGCLAEQQEVQAEQREPALQQGPVSVHLGRPQLAGWSDYLNKVAAALHHLRFALLDVSCFARTADPVVDAATSRTLQAVSGRPYPPASSQVSQLGKLLRSGRLTGAFTGGGCLVRPLAGSKGGYALCVAQGHAEHATAALHQLSRQEQERQAARRERAATSGGRTR